MTSSTFEYDPRFGDIGIIDGGILSDGYGIVAQKVMRDSTLPRDARFLYAYLMTFMNGRACAFPGVDTQIEESGMSRKKYYEMRGILEERDLIRIQKGQRKGQRNSFNIYYFNMFPKPKTKETTPSGDSGKVTKPQVAQQFHSETVENLSAVENGNAPSGDSGKVTKPQVAQQFQCDTGQNETPNYLVNTCKSNYYPSNQPEGTSQVGTAHGRTSVSSRSDGRSDGSKDRKSETSNQRPATPLLSAVEADREWELMERATVNRNLIRAGRAPFNALVAQGYSPAEIRMAWEQRQKAARAEARKPRFFPQLKRWLESAAADGARAMIEALRAEGGGAVIPVGAPKTLPALASADERFGRAYWAFLDARSRVAEAGGDPASDADCKRLHRVMQSERKAAYERFAAKQE